MFRLFSIKYPFLAPDITGGPAGGAGTETLPSSDSKEDVIEFLNDDDPEETIDITDKKPKREDRVDTDDKKAKKEKDDDNPDPDEDDDPEEPDELAEFEEELKEPTEEQLELVTPVRRREILKKYPKLFEDFPYLEKAYYREQQFTEIFATIDNAKQVAEKSEVLDRFESDLMSGNSETVLQAVKETNPKAFLKMVDEYLPTLAKVDEKAYYHVLGNVSKHTILAMVQEARKLGVGENGAGLGLQEAAHLLNKFVFGTSDFQPPSNLAGTEKPEDNSREKQLSDREQKFVTQQFTTTRNDLNTRVTNTLRNTIEANIDPKSSMSDYVRKNASRDAMDTLESLINKDARFKSLLDNLWKKAHDSNFSREKVDDIRRAYVSKAKTLLPSVLKKARNEALRGSGKRVKDDDDTTPRKGPVTPGRPRSPQSGGGKGSDKKEIPSGMSTLDFLSSD